MKDTGNERMALWVKRRLVILGRVHENAVNNSRLYFKKIRFHLLNEDDSEFLRRTPIEFSVGLISFRKNMIIVNIEASTASQTLPGINENKWKSYSRNVTNFHRPVRASH